MSCGRLFQSVGLAAANARSPTVRRWVRGTSSCSEDADCRRRRDGISTKWWRSSDKYGGVRPCSDRNTVVASLYWMRSEEHSQWHPARKHLLHVRRPPTDNHHQPQLLLTAKTSIFLKPPRQQAKLLNTTLLQCHKPRIQEEMKHKTRDIYTRNSCSTAGG